MKHVFRISSHLTFYLSKKIIEERKIKDDDCIFFLVRNYKVPIEHSSKFKHVIHTSYNVSSKIGRVFSFNFFKTKKNIKEFDKLVDAYIQGCSFIWYSQICNDDFCSLMVTKTNCNGYYVIEDGIGSYLMSNPQTFTGVRYYIYKYFLLPFFPRIFEVKNWYINSIHKKFLGCIASSSECFPLHKEYLTVVKDIFEKVELDFVPDAILSVDPLFYYIEEDDLKKIFRDLSLYMKRKNYSVLAYKFHPYFNANERKLLKNKYEELIRDLFLFELIELSEHVVVENLLYTYQCDFYTNHSSIAVYASKMGAACYSYSPIIKKYVSSYEELSIVQKFCTPIIIQ